MHTRYTKVSKNKKTILSNAYTSPPGWISSINKKYYLGFVPKMGETLWYVATIHNEWVSILGFSVSALKCKARDQWIGWSYRHQYGRLKLIVNNNRFLSQPILEDSYKTGGVVMKIKADHMRSLPDFFKTIPDPRRDQGKRHQLSTVLAIATAAILCGMRGYKAISDWADGLGQ